MTSQELEFMIKQQADLNKAIEIIDKQQKIISSQQDQLKQLKNYYEERLRISEEHIAKTAEVAEKAGYSVFEKLEKELPEMFHKYKKINIDETDKQIIKHRLKGQPLSKLKIRNKGKNLSRKAIETRMNKMKKICGIETSGRVTDDEVKKIYEFLKGNYLIE